MKRLTLSLRLSLVFAVLLLACCGLFAWVQMRAAERHEQEVTQRLSAGLAAHIANTAELMTPGSGWRGEALRKLFDQLMAVNPNVEVYVLAPDGTIAAQAAPPGHLKRDRVDLAPVRQFLAGTMLPILGDDPRNAEARKVFSAAPVNVNGRDVGYVYVVLAGEDRDAVAADVAAGHVTRTALWSMLLVAAFGLVAGLVAFRVFTRPLRRLTAEVRRFEAGGMASLDEDLPSFAAVPGDAEDIATLRQAFRQMRQRMAQQWRELTAQDQQRRELFANLSHDLRTPLTSLHGYLETLLLKSETLSPEDRRRYLGNALDQSSKVGRLAQEMFELARLEYGVVQPEKEHFPLSDLVQDVLQKFALAAESRHQRLEADLAPDLPAVLADLGMMERVLTNLLDNAIRHTPQGSHITVQLRAKGGRVQVEVSDSGPGIPPELRSGLFVRPLWGSAVRLESAARGGGFGLLIVQRILQLHGSQIQLLQRPDRGAVFMFELPV
jgi:signal transduction histidine kinase